MSVLERVGYILVCIVGVFMAATAYIVYTNTVTGFPVAASFFWMMVIALPASLVLPKDLRPLARGDLSHSQRFALLYPTRTQGGVVEAFRRYGFWRAFLNAVMYTLSFGCLLYALQSGQPGVVVTLLVMNQLQPVLNALLGHVYLNDRVNNWRMYILGAGTTILGIMLYRYQLLASQHIAVFDRVMLIALVCLALSARTVIDARFRRKLDIAQTDAVAILMIGSLLLAMVWALIETGHHSFPFPNQRQMLGLIYIGIVPTVVGLVFQNIARDKLGVATSEAIRNIRPMFALVIGAVPFSWFAMRQSAFNWINYVGITLATLGIMIVVLFAKGEVHRPTQTVSSQT